MRLRTLGVNEPRHFYALLLLIVWLLVCISVFWWLQFRHLGTLDDYWATFSGEQFAGSLMLPARGSALVVHFVDPACPCSRFSVDHIEKMQTKFEADVEFLDYVSMTALDLRKQQLEALSIPAGPAVAIWAADGEMAYFGPYSGGSICGQGTDFVATTLGSLATGANPRWINQEAVGCYCQWKATSS